jgi:vancomycin resistance protein YoaR
MEMKKIIIIGLAALVVLFGGGFSGAYVYAVSSQKDTILKGVYINEVYVGEMTKAEATDTIEKTINQNVVNKSIVATYGDKSYTIPYSKLNAHYDVEKAVEEAFSYGKEGNLLKRFSTKWKMRTDTNNIEMQFVADTEPLQQEVTNIASDINYDALDATMSINNGKISFKDEKSGLKVDEGSLLPLLQQAVRPDATEEKVEIPVQVVEPNIKKADINQNYQELSSYTTTFNASNVNRTINVRIATKTINNTIVMPGKIYSMNKTLGPRTEAKGYKEASVIVGIENTNALAGGICQVTTTVYNAALMAGMEITERKPHGIAVAYAPIGMDATIYSDYIDMKFKNTSKYPIYISSTTGSNTLTVKVYGVDEHPGRIIKITSEIIETIKPETEYIQDSTLAAGKTEVEQKGVTGYKSITYKKVYQDGSLVSTEVLSRDTYKKANTIIRVGTKKSGTTPTTTPPVTPEVTPLPSTTPSTTPTQEPTPSVQP